ncbi:acyltransferase family protein [Fictibacillus macauensis ZFHKF-1]|uniref:Acyltransferase family protein n=1 Tax=Fictibacillus macauensis ZFHKF-1 TaxID=1196324 RepID=I8UG22_9BACL|nr:acyltransferase family protein [Fictibacillus macauensis]EIT85778.1 acyltransferase family protein [Fictibacillus macauensis ZFHKF-1]
MGTAIKERDYFFDNARFILIFLVVLGHFISPIKSQSTLLTTLYNFIYTFHMPAFILISGFFTKGVAKDGYLLKIAKKVLIPYVIFQIIYTFYYYSLYDSQSVKVNVFDPQWTLWFLLSLVFWNLLLKLFVKLTYPLFFAIVLGIAVGYSTQLGTYLSLQRTFVFFPLFLLGHYLTNRDFKAIFKPWIRVLALIFLFVLFISYHYWIPDEAKDWLLSSSSYEELLGKKAIYGGLIRLGLYLAMFLATFSFLAIIPRREFFFTAFGGRTLYIYLLHGFILKFLFTTKWFSAIQNNSYYFMLFVLALLITLVLASNPVIALAQPFIELRLTKLHRWFQKGRK